MNREILFRAKRKGIIDGNCYRSKYKNGDWVYGLITKQYSKEFWDKLNDEMRDIYGVSGIEIDRDTVGQFTGMLDKFGNEIFEGDIVKCLSLEYGYVNKEVYYAEDRARFVLGSLGSDYDFEEYINVEVIGNIYDNKELLFTTIKSY